MSAQRATTAVSLKNLRADAKRLDVRDNRQPGLWIRKSPRTERTASVSENELITYRVVYKRRSDNKTRQMILGKGSHLSLKEARRQARVVMGQVAEGKDPAATKQQWLASGTFEDLANQWLAFKRRQGRASTYLNRSQTRIKGLPDWFRAKKAIDIERVDIAAVLDGTANRGKAVETNRLHALISAVLKWAVSEGLLEDDASRGIKRRFNEVARERVFTDDELRAIWHGLEHAPASAGSKLAIRLCFVLGQRPKEIAHLRQDKLLLDGPHPLAIIDKVTAKNRTEHHVPLPRLAVNLLKEALTVAANSPWVFPNPSNVGPIDPHALAKIFNRARRREGGTLFGVKDAQLYDSKKTIATYLGELGHPDQFIGLLFNHLTAKSGTVTGKHYNHASYMRTKRELIDQWAQHLEKVIGH